MHTTEAKIAELKVLADQLRERRAEDLKSVGVFMTDHGSSIPGEEEVAGAEVKMKHVFGHQPEIDDLEPIHKGKERAGDQVPTMLDVANPKDAIGQTKAPMHMLPLVAQVWGALGMYEGALKYGEKNFRYATVRSSVYVSAAKRHLERWQEGQDRDPKTRVKHLGSVIACCAILLDAELQGTLADDRHITLDVDLDTVFNDAMEVVANLHEMHGHDVRLLDQREVEEV